MLHPIKQIAHIFGKKFKKIRFGQSHINHTKVIIDRFKLLDLLPKEGICAELGVSEGKYSEKILSINKPKKLYLIDKWEGKDDPYSEIAMNKVLKKFENEIKEGKVKIIRGDCVDNLLKFNDQYFDWVYIDSDHKYEYTLKELEICRLKVKNKGVIAGHDYCRGGPTTEYGVIEAVNEFCVKYDWEIIFLALEPNGFFSFALKKIN